MLTDFISHLESIEACDESIEWLQSLPSGTTPQWAWGLCDRGDWMAWYAGLHAGAPWSEERKPLVRALCECAHLAFSFAQGDEASEAFATLKIIEAWCRGEATQDHVRVRAYAISGSCPAAVTAFSVYESVAFIDCGDAVAASAANVISHTTITAAVYPCTNGMCPYTSDPHGCQDDSVAAHACAAAARAPVLARCAAIIRKHIPAIPTPVSQK
jgi:hypothetical protein